MTDQFTLQARTGAAVRLHRGQHLNIVNTHGTQVVDCWALSAADPAEHLSMPHCRNQWYRLTPRPGDRVELEAEMDCIVVLSACPHDIFPVNGADCTPKDVAYSVR
jgi:hypothetical protein